MYPLAGSSLNNVVPAPDDLYSGKIRSVPVTVPAGTYARGEVLELDADNVAAKLATAANAAAVMPFDVTLPAVQELAVYVGGDFNEDAVKLGGVDLAPVKAALRGRGIMLRKWGAGPDPV